MGRRFGIFAAVLALIVMSSAPAGAIKLTGDTSSNAIFGGRKADTLTGSTGIDFLFGKGNKKGTVDKLLGRDGDDVLVGGPGVDLMKGGAGEDHIVDTDGRKGDTLKGGDDDDFLISFDGAKDTLSCGEGDDDLAVADAKDVVSGSCEKVFTESEGWFDAVYLLGTDGSDSEGPAEHSTFVYAMGLGDDTVSAGTVDDPPGPANANALFYGGPGADTGTPSGTGFIHAYEGRRHRRRRLVGASGNDLFISADGGIDTITCGGGTDRVYADVDDTINDPENCETLKQFDETSVALS